MNHDKSKRTIHQAGDAHLDALLDLTAFASGTMPLSSFLDEVPRRIARIFQADVCSVYLLEGDGQHLVMRGNVGFVGGALGRVQLRVGEGMTGECVEYMRPVSAESAEKHAKYKHFHELGEERFPVFLAVPMRGRQGPLGALVVQRSQGAFGSQDIALLVVIGSLLAAVVRTTQLLDTQRDRTHQRRAELGARKVTLTGRPAQTGRALGSVWALRRPSSRASSPQLAVGDAQLVRSVKRAFESASEAVRSLQITANTRGLGARAGFLSTYADILADARLSERALAALQATGSPELAFSHVAREATRAATAMTRDPFLEDRARDVEDVCDALAALTAHGQNKQLPTRAILIGDQLSVFDLLVTSRADPVGVVLSEHVKGGRTDVLLELLGVPSLTLVQGLFRWAVDGDVALLDADHGILVLNPSRSEIRALRDARRGAAKTRPS